MRKCADINVRRAEGVHLPTRDKCPLIKFKHNFLVSNGCLESGLFKWKFCSGKGKKNSGGGILD